jgi:hypothetical protein
MAEYNCKCYINGYCGLITKYVNCEGKLEKCVDAAYVIRKKRATSNQPKIECYKMNKGECIGCSPEYFKIK